MLDPAQRKPMPLSGLFLLISLLSLISCSEKRATRHEQKNAVETGAKDQKGEKKHILFFGNSLTAGSGVEQSEAFPALIGERIDSLGLPYEVINAGLSGETSAGGLNRIDWILKQQSVAIFVLELGANDGLRGTDPDATHKNLQGIIDKVRGAYPNCRIIIAGMKVPPNMGRDYAREFESVFPELARENDAALIPFLLKDVGGNPELMQDDGLHPTAKGHKLVARNVWKVLKEHLKKPA